MRQFFDSSLAALAEIARSTNATAAFQSASGVEVKYKVEPSFNTPATGGAGAKRFRLTGGGLGLGMANIDSAEMSPDLQSSLGRYGSKNVSGGYRAEASVGTFDDLIEAVMRGTWVAAQSILFSTMTSVTTVADGIVAAAGDWRTQGVRVGQTIRPTGLADAANNRNLRVIGLTAAKITTAETLIVNAVADTTGTIDIGKRIIQPAVPIKRSFTFEEESKDVDEAELFTGSKISRMALSGGPDSMAALEFGIVGADEQALLGAATPYFTSPTVTSSIPLTLADAVIRFGGEDVAVLTALSLAIDNRQAGQTVIGGRVTPEVFEGRALVNGSVTAIRRDLRYVRNYLAETELELHVLLVEPEAEPKDYMSFFIGRLKLGQPTKDLGGDNALLETLPFTAGKKVGVTGYEDTTVQIQTT